MLYQDDIIYWCKISEMVKKMSELKHFHRLYNHIKLHH
jgi:hypothetical protein